MIIAYLQVFSRSNFTVTNSEETGFQSIIFFHFTVVPLKLVIIVAICQFFFFVSCPVTEIIPVLLERP